MYISQKGFKLIKDFEGLKLKAYKCVAGIWTIGYGHTKDVVPGQQIDELEATKLLQDDVWYFERGVESLVKVPITQGQFDALVSFSFNVGLDLDDDLLAEGLGDSTLLKRLNAGDYTSAADQFLAWNKARGRVVDGLVRRREAERALFLGVGS